MAESVQIITTQFKTDTSGLDKAAKSLGLTTDEATRLEKAFNEAGISMDILTKKAGEVGKSAEGFKSLKQQLKEARNEATLLAQKFGENSKEALNATKRVAQLTEELDDFNQRVKALNPEAKFNAVSQSLQGVLGGLQGVTGALQLFGSESEQVQKIAQKLQGALNLAQGINSVIGLKDAFANLRVVLGLTATAQTALATATGATTVATEGAAVASTAFGAALTATGIGAIVVALGGLIAGFVALDKSIQSAAFRSELLKKRFEDIDAARKLFSDTFDKALQKQLDLIDFQIAKAEARRASEEDILRLQIKRVEAERRALLAAQATGQASEEGQKKIQERLAATRRELELLQIRLANVPQKVTDVVRKSAQNIETIAAKGINLLGDPEELAQQTNDQLDVIATVINERSSDIKFKPFLTPEEAQAQIDVLTDVFTTAAAISTDFYQTISQANYESDLASLEDLKEKKLISEQDYQKRLKTIKQNAAEDDKKLAIFGATIAFAEALVKALTTKNPPAALILAATVGAANLARIIATPIPKFKHGTLNVGGGNMDSDGGSLAMVHPGEAIIPQDRNKLYAPALKAIYHKQISPREINAFVQNKLNGNIENRVTADVDTYGLARAMRRNNGVTLTNENSLARAIAKEMSSTFNRRRQ